MFVVLIKCIIFTLKRTRKKVVLLSPITDLEIKKNKNKKTISFIFIAKFIFYLS